MFVLAKGSLQFEAWRPHDYTDRWNWTRDRFLRAIEDAPDRDAAMLHELERINGLMEQRSPALTSNYILLHIILDNLTCERLSGEARTAHARRCQQIRGRAPLFDADEETLIAAGVAWRRHGTPHSQAAYDAADRLQLRDPMNPRLWDFIESIALPTLLNLRGNVTGWRLLG